MRLSHLPLRIATGAFILNSGLSKRELDPGAAKGMQAMAAGAIPQLGTMPPEQFGKLLSTAEIALGAALLLPIVPSALAGLGLTAFGAGLVQLYLKTPGMRQPGSIRPTQDGTAIAKDIWLVGAGLTLVLDDLLDRDDD
jgi:DoxX